MKRAFTILWQCSLVGILCVSMISMMACTVDEVMSSIDAGLQVASGLSAAVGAVNPADGALLDGISAIAEKLMNVVQADYDTYEKNKTASNLQNVVVAAKDVQNALPQELAALHISDPNAVVKATNWVNLLVDCASSLITEITGVSALSAKTATGHQPRAYGPLTAENIKARWTTDVCKGEKACADHIKVHHKYKL